MNLKGKINRKRLRIIKRHWPFLWCKILSKSILGKKTDFRHPNDINEKIQWLEFFTDTSQWSLLADKYAVREYVKERIGEKYLVPLLGHWTNAKDIDFNRLPQKFVIKPNNGSYDCVICRDKESIDLVAVRKKMENSLKTPFGYQNAEPHYLRIKPCIIAEELLEADTPEGLIDYKVWCFDGVPYCFFICFNRDNETHTVNYQYYDLNWQMKPEKMAESFRSNVGCQRPHNLDELIMLASKLSKGLPQVRVDFYIVRGRIYFGEMTLTSNFGMMQFYTNETLLDMGNRCTLPKRRFIEKISTFFFRWFPKL